MTTRIVLDGIGKSFGGLVALESVSLSIDDGEVLAIVGDNGAGKSTLMNVLAGAHLPTTGTMTIDGKATKLHRPAQAREAGIETVYQDLALVESQSATANMFLGREEVSRFGFLKRRSMRRHTATHLARVSINVPSPDALVRNLSGGQRQAVAIARATAFGAQIVLMDEPTAALGVQETQRVLAIIEGLRTNGIGVVIVSHNLDQVLEIADRVAVMRRGRLVTVLRTADTDGTEVISMITGLAGNEDAT